MRKIDKLIREIRLRYCDTLKSKENNNKKIQRISKEGNHIMAARQSFNILMHLFGPKFIIILTTGVLFLQGQSIGMSRPLARSFDVEPASKTILTLITDHGINKK